MKNLLRIVGILVYATMLNACVSALTAHRTQRDAYEKGRMEMRLEVCEAALGLSAIGAKGEGF